jgi:hypothetical protein
LATFSTENALLAFLLASWIFHTDNYLLNISTLLDARDDAPCTISPLSPHLSQSQAEQKIADIHEFFSSATEQRAAGGTGSA